MSIFSFRAEVRKRTFRAGSPRAEILAHFLRSSTQPIAIQRLDYRSRGIYCVSVFQNRLTSVPLWDTSPDRLFATAQNVRNWHGFRFASHRIRLRMDIVNMREDHA